MNRYTTQQEDMNMKYTRICPGCGEEFQTNHPRQKYCRKVKIKVCPICKEQFEQVCEAQVPKISKKPECIKASQSFFKPTYPKICKICGEEFELYLEQIHIMSWPVL